MTIAPLPDDSGEKLTQENHPNAKLARILRINLSRLTSLQQGSEEYTQEQSQLEQELANGLLDESKVDLNLLNIGEDFRTQFGWQPKVIEIIDWYILGLLVINGPDPMNLDTINTKVAYQIAKLYSPTLRNIFGSKSGWDENYYLSDILRIDDSILKFIYLSHDSDFRDQLIQESLKRIEITGIIATELATGFIITNCNLHNDVKLESPKTDLTNLTDYIPSTPLNIIIRYGFIHLETFETYLNTHLVFKNETPQSIGDIPDIGNKFANQIIDGIRRYREDESKQQQI